MSNILASAIANKSHLVGINRAVETSLGEIDLGPMMVYLIDSVDASALESLAEQFDVMGVKGWSLCTTDDQRRSLIKRAIELHRYAGTPWSIKEALRSVGFYDVTIFEHVGWKYDGSVLFNGSQQFGASSWANFSVLLDIGDSKGINEAQTELVTQLIEVYKSFRSHLVALTFKSTMEDTISVTDDGGIMTLEPVQDTEQALRYYLYDGTYSYDSQLSFGGSADISLETISNEPEDESVSSGMTDDPGDMTITYSDGTIETL